MTSDIAAADYAVVKAILEANNILLEERTLPHGQRVLILDPHVEGASGGAPVVRPVLFVDRKPDTAKVRTTRETSAPQSGDSARSYGGLLLTAVPERVRAQTELAPQWGVFVEDIDTDVVKRPELSSLECYDIVTRVNRDRLRDPQSFVKALDALRSGDVVQYDLLRGGRTKIVTVRMER